jgi:DNA-binding CsgD family transcriptional regulator
LQILNAGHARENSLNNGKRHGAGLSKKRFAAKLKKSRETVHTQLTAIYRIMKVHSRGEVLALLAAR